MESHTEVSRLLESPERATEQRPVSVTPACVLTVAICSLPYENRTKDRSQPEWLFVWCLHSYSPVRCLLPPTPTSVLRPMSLTLCRTLCHPTEELWRVTPCLCFPLSWPADPQLFSLHALHKDNCPFHLETRNPHCRLGRASSLES